MKYMIMMFGDAGTMMATQSKDWINEMIGFMTALDGELRDRGELVAAEGLADATQARVVSRTADGIVVTDGPFAETKESLIGYWVVDVEDDARLLDIAGRIVTYSQKVELRPVMAGPPEFE
jgi:hypothetical protein